LWSQKKEKKKRIANKVFADQKIMSVNLTKSRVKNNNIYQKKFTHSKLFCTELKH